MKNFLTFLSFLISFSASAELLTIVPADRTLIPLVARLSTKLYSTTFIVPEGEPRDVLIHLRSILVTSAASSTPFGNRVQMSAGVSTKPSGVLCSDSFMSSMSALRLAGIVNLTLPINLMFACRLNPGTYTVQANAYQEDGANQAARMERAIVDIK